MQLDKKLVKLVKTYPRFPDGRIDYTSARICPVIVCTVLYDDEVLLTYRSAEVIAYPETWNGIAGFIDELKSLEEITQDELFEEVGIKNTDIQQILVRKKLVQTDENINREWHTFPVLVKLKHKPEVKTNWENKEAKWVSKSVVLDLELLQFYPDVFKAAMGDEL